MAFELRNLPFYRPRSEKEAIVKIGAATEELKRRADQMAQSQKGSKKLT